MEYKITRLDGLSILEIGQEKIPISSYTWASSADGNTELTVTIKGKSNLEELSSKLESLKQ